MTTSSMIPELKSWERKLTSFEQMRSCGHTLRATVQRRIVLLQAAGRAIKISRSAPLFSIPIDSKETCNRNTSLVLEQQDEDVKMDIEGHTIANASDFICSGSHAIFLTPTN